MERIDYILDFCKELGKQMIVCGANIERVNLCVEKICHAYGLHDVTCANLTTRISISAKDENKNYAHRQTDVQFGQEPPEVRQPGTFPQGKDTRLRDVRSVHAFVPQA